MIQIFAVLKAVNLPVSPESKITASLDGGVRQPEKLVRRIPFKDGKGESSGLVQVQDGFDRVSVNCIVRRLLSVYLTV